MYSVLPELCKYQIIRAHIVFILLFIYQLFPGYIYEINQHTSFI